MEWNPTIPNKGLIILGRCDIATSSKVSTSVYALAERLTLIRLNVWQEIALSV